MYQSERLFFLFVWMKRDADRERSEMSNLSLCREEHQCTPLSVSQVYFTTTTLENAGKTPLLLQCRTKCFGSIVCLPWGARNCAGMVSLIEWGKKKYCRKKRKNKYCTGVQTCTVFTLRYCGQRRCKVRERAKEYFMFALHENRSK